ncbi:hypothetical protein [Modestobacter marinus]|uniref:hypothetical protein n=1 Tax=Modestobacter marinus TaxID=477641 RepID=UPI001C93E5F7|nr:hypothetical protein [Modestobacter marinus]
MTGAAPPVEAPPGRWLRRARLLPVLLAVGLAVQLAPVLLLPVVLTQDGPAHVAGAWVLAHHGDDDAVGELLRRHYAVDLTPVPNMLTTLLLRVLLTVLSPVVAEKVVVGGFVVLLVAGLGYALRGVDRPAGWLAVAALPLAGSELVAYGFYNFCWGVALALFVVGLALRRRAGWSRGSAVALAGLSVLAWFSHLMPWAVAAGLVLGLGLGRSAAARWAGEDWPAALRRHLLGPVLALAPTVALSALYVSSGDGPRGAPVGEPSLERLGWLLSLYRPLVVGSRLELGASIGVAVVLAVLLAGALWPRATPADRPRAEAAGARADRWVLGLGTLAATAGFLLSPTRLGREYGFLPDRLAWFPPLLLVLFCATRPPVRAAARVAVAGALVVAATAAVLVRLPTQLHDQRVAADVLSVADDLPPGATLAVLWFTPYRAQVAPLESGPDPLRHVSSGLAVRARGVDVGHYEAVFPYFQVRFVEPSLRSRLDPELAGLEDVPPSVDLPAVSGELDYVLLVDWEDASASVRADPDVVALMADLRSGYRPVPTSSQAGTVALWESTDRPSG